MAAFPSPPFPRPSCHAVVIDQGRLLMIQRASPPFQGYWGLPGGSVEWGETVAEALQREVHEETGLIVKPEKLLGVIDAIHREAGTIRYHYVVLYYAARWVGGRLVPGSDASRADWFDLKNLAGVPMVPNVLDMVARSHGGGEGSVPLSNPGAESTGGCSGADAGCTAGNVHRAHPRKR